MARVLQISSYLVRIATSSKGFNEWRANVVVRTEDASTSCDIRLVDDVATWQQFESVDEMGWSTVFVPYTDFENIHTLLRTEQPLFLGIFGPPVSRVVIQSNAEPPGEEELTA
jgi:hypothetical protein